MPLSQASSDLTQRIQQLLDQRQQLTKAIASIDETLARVGAALATDGRAPKPVTSVKKPATSVAKPVAPTKPAAVKPTAVKSPRKAGKFAMSGEQSILTFVKTKSNPRGGEIETQWRAEGRKGRAINIISKLVKDKKLKRLPLKGERGSRYSLA